MRFLSKFRLPERAVQAQIIQPDRDGGGRTINYRQIDVRCWINRFFEKDKGIKDLRIINKLNLTRKRKTNNCYFTEEKPFTKNLRFSGRTTKFSGYTV